MIERICCEPKQPKQPRQWAAGLLLLLLLPVVAAAEISTASGTLTYGKHTVEINDVEAVLDQELPGSDIWQQPIVLRLKTNEPAAGTSFEDRPDSLTLYFMRFPFERRLVAVSVKYRTRRVVGNSTTGGGGTTQFPPDDAIRTDGLTFRDGVISGKIHTAGLVGELAFTVTLNVPLATLDAPLAAGGGEPGQTYQAFHSALLSSDLAALKSYTGADLAAQLTESTLNALQPYFSKLLPAEIAVVDGFANSSHALLKVQAASSGDRNVTGAIKLVMEQEQWRIADWNWLEAIPCVHRDGYPLLLSSMVCSETANVPAD